jgi:uncharacterized membrane protein
MSIVAFASSAWAFVFAVVYLFGGEVLMSAWVGVAAFWAFMCGLGEAS